MKPARKPRLHYCNIIIALKKPFAVYKDKAVYMRNASICISAKWEKKGNKSYA